MLQKYRLDQKLDNSEIKEETCSVNYFIFIYFMQKFWEISRQIHDFMTWKQVECPFEKDKKIQSYLLTAPIYSEEGKIMQTSNSPPKSLFAFQTVVCKI